MQLDGLRIRKDRVSRCDSALRPFSGFGYLISARCSIGTDVRGFWVATNAQSPLDAFVLAAAAHVGVRFDLH